MDEQRIFIVGDIHGCLNDLKGLMGMIDWEPDQDRLIFLGDYIDRGEDPKGVVDYILQLSGQSPFVQCLMGNHEGLFRRFLQDGDVELCLLNGAETTFASYGISLFGDREAAVPPDHLAFYNNLIPWIELDDFFVVHAGFRPGVDVRDQDLEDLLWIREPFLFSECDFGKRVIFGHTPFWEPLVQDDKIGLDTGAVYGNKLTCLEIPDMIFHSIAASPVPLEAIPGL
jgi:serine/threonine protein phosphatase 1